MAKKTRGEDEQFEFRLRVVEHLTVLIEAPDRESALAMVRGGEWEDEYDRERVDWEVR